MLAGNSDCRSDIKIRSDLTLLSMNILINKKKRIGRMLRFSWAVAVLNLVVTIGLYHPI
jgi:hypothetical protein